MKKLFSYLVVLIMASTPVLVFWRRQQIFDWYTLRNYVPSSVVSGLAERTTMNSKARNLFYVYDPVVVSDKEEFRSACSSGEQTIVLGCFRSSDKIYVYDVQDERLSGIHEVTAAHELLHAAYERLSEKDKTRIDALLDAAYSETTNTRLRDTVEQYRSRDPSVVPNELHSIIGTEVRTISQELERYYSNYFTDRSKIVSYSEQYEQEFVDHEKNVEKFDNELQQQKLYIEGLETEVTQLNGVLSSKKRSLDLTSQQDVDEYNELVNDYNAKVTELQDVIEAYNSLVRTRNDEAKDWQSLVEAIDTRVETLE